MVVDLRANDAVKKPMPSRQGDDMRILQPFPESKQSILECPGGSFLYGNFSKFFQGVFLQINVQIEWRAAFGASRSNAVFRPLYMQAHRDNSPDPKAVRNMGERACKQGI